MNDENKHNDPIERLFREKAGEYDISYREEDWLKLEKQLDARAMQHSYRRKLRWLAAASFLILSLIGYYTLQNRNKINQLTEQLNNRESVQQEDSQPGRNLTLDDEDPSDETPSASEEEVGQESFAEATPAANVNHVESTDAQQTSDKTIPGETESDQTAFFMSKRLAERADVIGKKSVEPSGFITVRSSIPGILNEQPETIASSGSGFSAYVANTETGFEEGSPLAALTNYGEMTNQSGYSRFAIGLAVSPDLSTVGSVSNFYDPGYKTGIMAEYSLNETFSVISGVAISNVRYKAAGNLYHPPEYWNSGVMPDRTKAVCLVLDIPVNLKSNLFNFEHSRIFATAGISSYIMLNEDYKFRYNGDSSGLQTSWSDRTGTRHWFSNLGFSAGMEWDLSRNWSFRAEPHIKIPIRGVGWGDVKLYSMGSFFSLNYKL